MKTSNLLKTILAEANYEPTQQGREADLADALEGCISRINGLVTRTPGYYKGHEDIEHRRTAEMLQRAYDILSDVVDMLDADVAHPSRDARRQALTPASVPVKDTRSLSNTT